VGKLKYLEMTMGRIIMEDSRENNWKILAYMRG
jgi:hypothetical protein